MWRSQLSISPSGLPASAASIPPQPVCPTTAMCFTWADVKEGGQYDEPCLEDLDGVLHHRKHAHVGMHDRAGNVAGREDGSGRAVVTTDAGARLSLHPIHSSCGDCPMAIRARFSLHAFSFSHVAFPSKKRRSDDSIVTPEHVCSTAWRSHEEARIDEEAEALPRVIVDYSGFQHLIGIASYPCTSLPWL